MQSCRSLAAQVCRVELALALLLELVWELASASESELRWASVWALHCRLDSEPLQEF